MYQAQPAKKQCNFCSREGLLIYPTRYAVACPAGAAGVPGLSGNFNISGAPPEVGPAKYTLRSLRPGYLYSYDEKRRRLKAYVVTPKGFLSNFPLQYLAPGLAKATFRCTDPGEITIAHCVDIAHTPRDPAGNLWLGWSSVMWTQALIDNIGDAAWRTLHMQCIDVRAMLAGSAPHTGEFEQTHQQVAHFAADAAAMKLAFDFSNNPIENEVYMHGWSGQMRQMMAAHGPHHKGYVVAVNDPVGITNDLSELTVPSLHNGFDEDAYRGQMVHDMLAAAEHCVREAARENVLFRDTLEKNSQTTPDGDPVNAAIKLWEVIKAGGPEKLEKKRAADRELYGAQQSGRQNAAADHAWENVISMEIDTPPHAGRVVTKRKALLDRTRLEAFPMLYAQALQEFTPLYDRHARLHHAWLTSSQLANWMQGVHDDSDIRSGYAYSESTGQCLGKAVSSKLCIDQLNIWLNSSALSDIHNLYARALLFNQAALIKATEASLKGSDLQFDGILSIYTGALDRLENGHAARLIDRLALTTANVLVNAMKHSSVSVMRKVALTHFALIGKDIVRASDANVDVFAKFIREQARASNINLNMSSKQIKAAAHSQARAAINSRAPGLIGWELDMEKLQREGLTSPGLIKGVKLPGFDMTNRWLGSSVPDIFHRGVVTLIVQMVALAFVSQDLVNNDRFNESETRLKTALAVANLCATTMNTAGKVTQESSIHPLAVYLRDQWAVNANKAAKITKWSARAALITGVVAGAYDMYIGWQTMQDGGRLLGELKFLGGALGCALAIAGYVNLAIFWPLFIFAIGINILIALINNSALQDWISRCYFSNEVSTIRAKTSNRSPFQPYPFPTMAEELKSFNSAVGA